MVSLPTSSVESSFSTGAIALHGPHHSAQKSTKTGVVELFTVSSKLLLVRVIIPSAMVVQSVYYVE